MTEEERITAIVETIWYWFPARWSASGSWLEIRGFQITGDVSDGGVTINVSRDDAAPVGVDFTNAELYGETRLSFETARTRVEAV